MGPSRCSGGRGVSAQPEGAGPHLILCPHQDGGSGPKRVPGAGTPWQVRSAQPLSRAQAHGLHGPSAGPEPTVCTAPQRGPSPCHSCALRHRKGWHPTCTAPMAITHMQNRKMPRGTSGKVTIKENCSQKNPQHQGPRESTGPCLGHCEAIREGSISATGALGLKLEAFKAEGFQARKGSPDPNPL